MYKGLIYLMYLKNDIIEPIDVLKTHFSKKTIFGLSYK